MYVICEAKARRTSERLQPLLLLVMGKGMRAGSSRGGLCGECHRYATVGMQNAR